MAIYSVVLTLCLFLASVAQADGGELTLSAVIDQELSTARYVGNVEPQSPLLRFYTPRFGGSATYGITHRLRLGLVGRGSLPNGIEFPIEGLGSLYRGGALVARTRDALATVLAAFTVYDGDLLFFDLGIEAGLSFRQWRLTDRINDGVSLPINDRYRDPTWHRQPYLRAQAELRLRPWQYIVLAAAPYVATTFDKTVSFGLAINAGVPLSAGPNW